MRWILATAFAVFAGAAATANASIAYGSLDNFDCVNDTGQECHGFEIEIDDIRCRDITYTYDWNHYGAPRITEDLSDPAHPKCFVRYESGKKPDGSWAAYTAIPSGPIAPTDGHMFTDPSVNFGGEHYGVGFYGAPTAVKYNWLVDDGAGNLIHGGVVNISTPVFNYYPPVAQQPAQVQAVVALPPPPAAPLKEFGDAMWVKVTTTQSHNNNKVELADLVSDDPNDPNDRNWKNGEADEVEVEWQLMQTEFAADGGGANGEQVGAPEELPDGDEVITRRYDFYKYVGPLDPETGEARTDSVGPDDLHGIGIKNIDGVDVDFSTIVVVGDYVGAQMAAFDAEGKIGLIDHLQDGVVYEPYIERRVVVGGSAPILTTVTGSLPVGMTLDVVNGILSGTPESAGVHTFTVHSTDANGGDVTQVYNLNIVLPAGEGEGEGEGQVVLDPHDLVTPYYTIAALLGDASNDLNQDGVCDAEQLTCLQSNLESGASPAVDTVYLANRAIATAALGPDYLMFIPGFDSLVAAWTMLGMNSYIDYLFAGSGIYNVNSYDVSQNAAVAAIIAACNVPSCGAPPVTYSVTTAAVPVEGGSTSGDGVYNAGSVASVGAIANAGYRFAAWSVGSVLVSANEVYSFDVNEDAALVASFERITYTIGASAAPTEGGSVSGGGVVNHGDSVTLVATPNAGYRFTGWTEGGAAVSSDAAYTFTASADRALVANFVRITYTVALNASPATYGTVSGGGTVNDGDTVTVIATPNAGYRFVSWKESGVVVSTAAAYGFTASANRTLVATFAVLTYNVVTKSYPIEGGTTTGGGTKLAPGTPVTVVATPNAGYNYLGWYEGGVLVTTSTSYSFNVNANRTLVAKFLLVTYKITATASPTAGGTATGGGAKILPGTPVTLTATPNAGYGFGGWLEGGVLVSSSETYSFTASANRALVAKFVVLPSLRAVSVVGPVVGGNTTTGTVTLSSVAPLVGTEVSLSSANAALLGVPASVTIAGGQRTATFTVTTVPVTASKVVAVTATKDAIVKTVNVRINVQ